MTAWLVPAGGRTAHQRDYRPAVATEWAAGLAEAEDTNAG